MSLTISAAGFRLARALPESLLTQASVAFGASQRVRPVAGLRQWQRNAEIMAGRPPTAEETGAAAASWARNLTESITLDRWSPDRIINSIVISDEDLARLRTAFSTTGAVLALPHLASWDLAGAWVTLLGMPVSSVAEQLADAEFEFFCERRAGIGFRIHSHREPGLIDRLTADQESGRLVCLLADRDFSRRGVPVIWRTGSGPVPGSMPPGPAVLALRTGAALLGVLCHYLGEQMVIEIPEAVPPASGDEAVATMTQALADVLAAGVREHVVDWHMLQPFFGVRGEGLVGER